MTRVVLAFALVLSCAGVARAHSLDEGTARISLRDGHVEVVAEWDLFRLVEGTPTQLATASEEALVAEHRRLERAIESGTRLRVDGADVPLVLTNGPSVGELRALAASLSAAGEDHGTRVRLRLEARPTFTAPRAVALTVPGVLGPVVVSFVQPASSYTLPGETASFTVLQRPPAPTASTRAPSTPLWAGAAAACVACLAALLLWRVRGQHAARPSTLAAPTATTSSSGAAS